jgi:hypothetical protein
MSSVSSNTITLNADQEHAGLRAVVLLIVMVGFILGFRTIDPILGGGSGFVATYSFAISCVLALVLALAVAAVGEGLMKRNWPSGRRVEIDDLELRAWLPDEKTATLDWSHRVWAITWTFSLAGYPRGGRERRLTAKHHCYACQLQQDEKRVIIFGYLKGRQVEELPGGSQFHGIDPSDFYERRAVRWIRGATDRPKIPTNVLSGKDGPYWLAEKRRWSDGIELTAKDFLTFWEVVKDRVEE